MNDKTYIQGRHYTYDEVTRKITFVKEEHTYKIEKHVFGSHGVDIDEIQTIEEYERIRMQHTHEVMAIITEQWRRFKPRTLEEKRRKCLMINDTEGFKRLRKLIDKKNAIKLKIIK